METEEVFQINGLDAKLLLKKPYLAFFASFRMD